MTTSVSEFTYEIDSEHEADKSRKLDDPQDRGTLTIDPSVVRKVAEYVADQVPGTRKVERKIVGIGVSTHGATVKIAGQGNDIDLAVDLSLRYPVSIRTVVDAVRAKVIEELDHITSYHVRSFDVRVSALVPDSRSRVH